MTKPILTFWYEFASPYSWLAAERADALAEAAGVELCWRAFLLGPILAALGWKTSPFNLQLAKGRHMWRDIERHCALLDLPPLTRPDPFPQNGLLAARVATALPDESRPAFSRAAFRAEFTSGGPIADRAAIADILRGCGLDADATLAAAETPQIKTALRAATEDASARGIFGAPSFTTAAGELFWGNDRLEPALHWARKETEP